MTCTGQTTWHPKLLQVLSWVATGEQFSKCCRGNHAKVAGKRSGCNQVAAIIRKAGTVRKRNSLCHVKTQIILPSAAVP